MEKSAGLNTLLERDRQEGRVSDIYTVIAPDGMTHNLRETDRCTLFMFGLIVVQCLHEPQGVMRDYFDSHADPFNVERTVKKHLKRYAQWKSARS